MQLTIDRISAQELSAETFFAEYYLTEKPLLISAVTVPEDDANFMALPDNAAARLRNGNLSLPLEVTAPGGCINVQSETSPSNHSVPSSELSTPELVRAVFARNDIIQRPLPVRAWLHLQGYRTPLHFDGNSLHGFNWQLQGHKRWTLISPDTPARLMPLTYFAMTHRNFQPDPAKHDFAQFETKPGDLLFLPRYWQHAVDALAPRNRNLNWVWTSTYPNPGVFVGRRECAILRLMRLVPQLRHIPRYQIPVRNYADGGETLSGKYADAVSWPQTLATLCRELAAMLMLPFYHNSVNQQMDEMEDGTFGKDHMTTASATTKAGSAAPGTK